MCFELENLDSSLNSHLPQILAKAVTTKHAYPNSANDYLIYALIFCKNINLKMASSNEHKFNFH